VVFFLVWAHNLAIYCLSQESECVLGIELDYYFLIVYLNCSDGVVCLDFHFNTVFMGLYFNYMVGVSFIAG